MIQNKLLIFLLILISVSSLAQNNSSSSYSRFGIGILNSKADATNAGMGFAGLALGSKGYLNTLNSASYSALDSAKFVFNIQGKMSFADYQTSTDQQSNFDANVESLSIGFRAGKNWGMGFSLAPYSSIGYSISGEKYILGTMDKYPVELIGEGGISQLSWTNGFQVAKGLSLGLNTSYLWGSTDVIEVSEYPAIIGETIYNKRTYQVSSLLFDFGLQYRQAIGRNSFSIGGTFSLSSELDTYFEHKIYNDYSSDLSSSKTNSDNLLIPLQYQAGMAFQTHSGITIAGDYRFGQWHESELSITNGEVRDTHGASFGVQYASPRYHRNFFKRLQYRLGVFYNQQYLTIQGNNIDSKGVTAGLTIPMRDGSRINIAYEYDTRGTINAGLVEENYNTIRLGLTFNENWFQKRKFD
ncbi:hypothetical protein [Carboxylicivirga sp. M1479]|uniref:hypothetical protein n=1 Tax=Carboxylicivirga sp. M1479 TaxID=2594476 RepID=UPI0011784E76|nr:hypothetical protein [Carboxylicivirga sp. M1479]TRX70406.1 hypothetical protein FNN09_11820 [Carboxylicivirga sp. M1479]